ncbi:MAG TPA: hypothetical protein PKA37_11190 [Planctomycetota bacterium]|nr:hypothetical protein [Planctomycetota bacterium]
MGNRRKNVRAYQKELTREREAIEIRVNDVLQDDGSLHRLVVHRDAAREPYHRWLPYRQGFSFELVRRFLDEASVLREAPILDPFSGSGTVPLEVARAGLLGLGMDAVASLAYLGQARMVSEWSTFQPPPSVAEASFEALFHASDHPHWRAACLLALAGTLDGEGRSKPATTPCLTLVEQAISMMREDGLRERIAGACAFIHGDARRLPLGANSVGGILTSPPYLSRYDYSRVNAPLDLLLRSRGMRKNRGSQLRASRSTAGRGGREVHPAVEEVVQRLLEQGHQTQAAMVSGYFADLAQVLAECRRVLRPAAPLWVVIAGADIKREYVPSDAILAEIAAGLGLQVEEIREARRMRPQGRSLGGIQHVAPRESLVVLRR